MIKGNRKVELTPDVVLNKISAFDIFRMYMPDKRWEINQCTLSPFRRESSPSFIIGNRTGELLYIDYGDSSFRGDCFEFVKQLFNLSLNEVLLKLDRDFGLGITSNVNQGNYKKIKATYEQPEGLGKRYSLIQVITRKFTNEELEYWNEYYQDYSDLRENNVYSIKELFLNRKKFSLKNTELRFGYLYNGYWKIYRPFAEKRHKWLSNVPIITTDGLLNLSKEHNGLIAKSKKDYMVCKKVWPHTCGVQNESLVAFSAETLNHIKSNSKTTFYAGDSDSPGKKASWLITEAFGFKHINSPDRLLPEINDFAGWARKEGLDKLEEHFKIKGIYD